MTALALPFRRTNRRSSLQVGPIARGVIGVIAVAATTICLITVVRGLTGIGAAHPDVRNIAVIIHLATVLPAIPLGGYLLIARKGDRRHKQLGKLWIGLMVTTAIAITFIRGGTDFSWIHIFVPVTLIGSWQVVSAARKGQIFKHKMHIYNLYFGALLIPGAFAFLPGRLMGTWLFG